MSRKKIKISSIATSRDEAFIHRIESLIQRCGGQSGLARKAGLSLGAVQRYLKGGEPTRSALMRLAEAGDVSLAWLTYGLEENESAMLGSTSSAGFPLYGFAESTQQGWYEEVAYKMRAAADWPDPACFAVVAPDSSLIPEGIRPGYVCIVSPHTRPHENDIAFIRRNDGTATLRVYLREDTEWLHTKAWLEPEKKNARQINYTDQIKRKAIRQTGTVVLIKRRMN